MFAPHLVTGIIKKAPPIDAFPGSFLHVDAPRSAVHRALHHLFDSPRGDLAFRKANHLRWILHQGCAC